MAHKPSKPKKYQVQILWEAGGIWHSLGEFKMMKTQGIGTARGTTQVIAAILYLKKRRKQKKEGKKRVRAHVCVCVCLKVGDPSKKKNNFASELPFESSLKEVLDMQNEAPMASAMA